ncbi:MAG: class I SAM-dependent rRNA methyltransferase [Bryobacteraceae bacterium]
MTTVRVNRKGAGRVASGHPWIFASDVTERGAAEPGSTVTVADPSGRSIGTAHYSSTSQITLRMLGGPIPDAIKRATRYRASVVAGTDAWRVVHAEGDQLPGLIVDKYGDFLCIQLLSQGMDRARDDIAATLDGLFAPRAIVARNDAAVRKLESLPVEKTVLRGAVDGPAEVRMNGFRWRVDLLEGQKTGIYLDQRENYVSAAGYARGRALDCFASTGGFAIHMAARCDSVEAIDSSAPALETALANAGANAIANIEFRQADVFEQLAAYSHARRRFDTIVLDPPAFAKSRSAVEGAARGYRDINFRALRLLEPGGTLVTCSCSHHLSEAALLEIVAEAALQAGRTLRVVERRTQSRDHPILLTVPETHYLKCLILQAG